MYSSTAYRIRPASDDDTRILHYISALDSQRPLTGDALIGEIDGSPAAAISLTDGRVVADPFRPTAELAAHLRARAIGINAALREPRLRDRIRGGIRLYSPVRRSAGWPNRTPIHQSAG